MTDTARIRLRQPSDFRDRAEAVALAWKRTTTTLPDDARKPGAYLFRDCLLPPRPICLPPQYSVFNLLPDVRESALELFRQEEIVWHDDVGSQPSNHLLDSQVQCLNALAPGLTSSDFVKRAFGHVLPIDEVLPIEGSRYITFEYIGAEDYLGERNGLRRIRGSMTTSTDAAIRYRTPEGRVEAALVEWKFTEDYRGRYGELTPAKGRPREERYRAVWDEEGCPLRRDLIPYEDLFVEPFYQLIRQQLLAWKMEQAGELGASVVRVVHACPSENEGVHKALNRPSHHATGEDALSIWADMCLQPDSFIRVDTAMFARDGEFSSRYQGLYAEPAGEK